MNMCTCTNTNDVTPIQLVTSLQQIVLHILSNDCVANLTYGVLGTQSDTPVQLAIGNWHLLWRRFLLGLALDPHSQKDLHMQTQLLHLHLILHLHLPPDYLPFQLNMGCIFCLSCTIWAGRALLDSVTYIICIICLLTVATNWRTCLPAALAQMPRYLIMHSCPNIYRVINCQNRISAQYQTRWPQCHILIEYLTQRKLRCQWMRQSTFKLHWYIWPPAF